MDVWGKGTAKAKTPSGGDTCRVHGKAGGSMSGAERSRERENRGEETRGADHGGLQVHCEDFTLSEEAMGAVGQRGAKI